jgi:hypothetical protein
MKNYRYGGGGTLQFEGINNEPTSRPDSYGVEEHWKLKKNNL